MIRYGGVALDGRMGAVVIDDDEGVAAFGMGKVVVQAFLFK